MIGFLIFTGFVLGFFSAAIVFGVVAISARREIPPMETVVSATREPGETESDVYGRLLQATPSHQVEMRKSK